MKYNTVPALFNKETYVVFRLVALSLQYNIRLAPTCHLLLVCDSPVGGTWERKRPHSPRHAVQRMTGVVLSAFPDPCPHSGVRCDVIRNNRMKMGEPRTHANSSRSPHQPNERNARSHEPSQQPMAHGPIFLFKSRRPLIVEHNFDDGARLQCLLREWSFSKVRWLD